MSHRVTTRTEIRDKSLAIQALKSAGLSFIDRTNSLEVTSGPMMGATIDLRTGNIEGSFDVGLRDSNNSLGFLKRHYAEAKIMQEFMIRGIAVESREVLKDGSIRLICQGDFERQAGFG